MKRAGGARGGGGNGSEFTLGATLDSLAVVCHFFGLLIGTVLCVLFHRAFVQALCDMLEKLSFTLQEGLLFRVSSIQSLLSQIDDASVIKFPIAVTTRVSRLMYVFHPICQSGQSANHRLANRFANGTTNLKIF